MIRMNKLLSKSLILVVSSLALMGCGNKSKEQVDTNVRGVELNQSEVTLSLSGEKTVQLVATISPDTANNKTVVWTSDNPCAKVSEKGLVTAYSVGVANIKVTTLEAGKTAVCVVTVIE